MSEKNPIDEHFRQHLADAEVQPNADLWDKVEQRLDDSKSKRKGWLIGIAASIALAFAITSLLYDQYSTPQQGTPTIVNEGQPDTETTTPLDTEKVAPLQLDYETKVDPSTIAVEHNEVAPEAQNEPAPANTSAEKLTPIANEESSNRVYAMADTSSPSTETEDQQQATAIAATPEPKIGVRVKFDPYRYLASAEPTSKGEETTPAPESAPAKKNIGEYAEEQLNNIIEGKELEAPVKSEIKWPALSINISPIMQKLPDLSRTEN